MKVNLIHLQSLIAIFKIIKLIQYIFKVKMQLKSWSWKPKLVDKNVNVTARKTQRSLEIKSANIEHSPALPKLSQRERREKGNPTFIIIIINKTWICFCVQPHRMHTSKEYFQWTDVNSTSEADKREVVVKICQFSR